jgi:hypothetical protein
MCWWRNSGLGDGVFRLETREVVGVKWDGDEVLRDKGDN